MSYRINSFIKTDKAVASYENRLSICITSNGFSFSVVSRNEEVVALCDVECDITAAMAQLLSSVKAAFTEVGVQTFGMKECELIVPTRQFVWIPMHLYDETKNREYIEAIHKLAVGESVFADYNAAVGANLVFVADSNLVSAFRIAIPGLKIRAQHSKMVNNETLEASQMKSLMIVNIRGKECDYAIVVNRKLQLSNTFSCANIDEMLYYAVNINKQLRLDDLPLCVALCGDVDRESFAHVKEFFSDVVLYTGRNLQLSTEELRRAPIYRYALILS